jgi:L-alanine-DL-glutamate epimerase-like enolase superfamily enzyme
LIRTLTAGEEVWPLSGTFVISRGAKSEARVVTVEITESGRRGRGECTPYPRFGETTESVLAEIGSVRGEIENGCDREDLQGLLPPGAARNALDCALWDLEAKITSTPAFVLAGRRRLEPVKTAYTISLGSPEAMAEAARAASRRPMLKLKLGGVGDLERVRAVREAAPLSRLIVDANEALSEDEFVRLAPELKALDVKLIEQPLPADQDGVLDGFESPIPLCADESLKTRAELGACARRYQCVNIKLDKAGGLTEALALADAAKARGLMIMAGSMVATSLAMAPAMILAQGADFVDLDSPLLLARDRSPGLAILGSMIEPPPPELWG